jgi:hypothetical protein
MTQDYGKQLFPLKSYTPFEQFKNYSLIGGFSGFFQTFIDCPIENLKIHSINGVKQSLPFSELYCGYVPNLIRNIKFAAFVYAGNQLAAKYNLNSFLMGGLGGFLGCISSHPWDYLKTIKQANHGKSYHKIIKETIGIRRYFIGCIPRANMGFISMGVGSFVLDLLKKN